MVIGIVIDTRAIVNPPVMILHVVVTSIGERIKMSASQLANEIELWIYCSNLWICKVDVFLIMQR